MVAKHPDEAARFVADLERARWHDRALWFVREKRDRMAHTVPEWEQLRQTATEIKQYVLTHLDQLLLQFAENAEKNGIHVHWARDAAEHKRFCFRSFNGITRGGSSKASRCLPRNASSIRFSSRTGSGG
ncbi:MAG: hypothetical protein R3C12_00395 [Planctomycetaceae bacterium]